MYTEVPGEWLIVGAAKDNLVFLVALLPSRLHSHCTCNTTEGTSDAGGNRGMSGMTMRAKRSRGSSNVTVRWPDQIQTPPERGRTWDLP